MWTNWRFREEQYRGFVWSGISGITRDTHARGRSHAREWRVKQESAARLRSHRQPARPIICSRAAMQKARWTDSAREICRFRGRIPFQSTTKTRLPTETRMFPPHGVRRAINLAHGIVNSDPNVSRCFFTGYFNNWYFIEYYKIFYWIFL